MENEEEEEEGWPKGKKQAKRGRIDEKENLAESGQLMAEEARKN
jgi:hypothetical protein